MPVFHYIGIQEGNPEDNFFVPICNVDGVTQTPRSQETFNGLAQASIQFLEDCLSCLRKGYDMGFNRSHISAKEAYPIFANGLLSRIDMLATVGAYHNPESPECKVFYSTIADLIMRKINPEPFIRHYEENSGYSFSPRLFSKYI